MIRDELPDWFSVLGKSRIMYDAKKIDVMACPTSRSGSYPQGFTASTEEPIAPADNGQLFSEAVTRNIHRDN